jgi:catechol-2,3-dioxygenase
MLIESLQLYTHQFGAMLDFYTRTLELPLIGQKDEQFTVSAGATALTFLQAFNGDVSPCHYAINIPEASFSESKRWLQSRTPLLTSADGKEEFYSENWNAHLLYYADPDGNIGELTARHTLPSSNDTRSTGNPILSVAEIGIAVDDVPAFVADLSDKTGLFPYRQDVEPTFTAVGDEHGLFIAVKAGRTWLPNNVVAAKPMPLQVRFRVSSAESPQLYELTGLPYTVRRVSALQ